MTKSEITSFITKNVGYTHTNQLHMWSDWWPFQPQNRKVLQQIGSDKTFTIEFSDNYPGVPKNNFRIRQKL